MIQISIGQFLLFRSWFQWGKSSIIRLAEAEARLFASFGAKVIGRFIPVGCTSTGFQYALRLGFTIVISTQ